jgi:DNA polymerase-3 subunit gamma/tau
MESFTVSALKYRPQNFDQVIGQDQITSTLKNAIETNQLAQALLFCGPRGVGKTSCARILAKAINDKENNSSDNDFAFNIFELDAASNNSVDDIRKLNDQIRIPPQIGNFKVYIIDEVHMLSLSAFNAFLKTLEEPPKHAIFILATTEKNKIIPTILSRCQIYDFKLITVKEIKLFLVEICNLKKLKFDDDALILIAQKADGAMRDALSIFDRMVSFTSGNLTTAEVSKNLNVLDYETFFSVSNLIKENKIPEILLEFNNIINKGYESLHFINGLANHIRTLILCKDSLTIELLEVGEKTRNKYLDQSKTFDFKWLLDALSIIKEAQSNHRFSINKRLNSELCLMQLASLHFNGEKKN